MNAKHNLRNLVRGKSEVLAFLSQRHIYIYTYIYIHIKSERKKKGRWGEITQERVVWDEKRTRVSPLEHNRLKQKPFWE